MRNCTRRDFLKTSIAGAGALATGPALLRGADSAGSFKVVAFVDERRSLPRSLSQSLSAVCTGARGTAWRRLR